MLLVFQRQYEDMQSSCASQSCNPAFRLSAVDFQQLLFFCSYKTPNISKLIFLSFPPPENAICCLSQIYPASHSIFLWDVLKIRFGRTLFFILVYFSLIYLSIKPCIAQGTRGFCCIFPFCCNLTSSAF